MVKKIIEQNYKPLSLSDISTSMHVLIHLTWLVFFWCPARAVRWGGTGWPRKQKVKIKKKCGEIDIANERVWKMEADSKKEKIEYQTPTDS